MNNNHNKILEKFTEIIVEQLDVDPEKVTLNTNFYNLYTDELDAIQLCIAIEEAFEIEISDEEAERLCTVRDVLIFVLNKKEIINKEEIIKKIEQEEQQRQRIKQKEQEERKRQREVKLFKAKIFKF